MKYFNDTEKSQRLSCLRIRKKRETGNTTEGISAARFMDTCARQLLKNKNPSMDEDDGRKDKRGREKSDGGKYLQPKELRRERWLDTRST